MIKNKRDKYWFTSRTTQKKKKSISMRESSIIDKSFQYLFQS